MPTTLNIPSRIERRCEPCEHHKCIGSFHVRSGEGSWREYVCQHPAADDELTPAGRALFGAGKYIGKTEKQPDWCPLRQSQNNKLSGGAEPTPGR
jgi:hypothetical protein